MRPDPLGNHLPKIWLFGLALEIFAIHQGATGLQLYEHEIPTSLHADDVETFEGLEKQKRTFRTNTNGIAHSVECRYKLLVLISLG